MTEFRRPLSKAGFGNKFRQWCNEAGLLLSSAHGGSNAVAENGRTTSELKAIFGWRSDKEAERYTQAADRKRLGSGADRLLARPNRERVCLKNRQSCVSNAAYPLILLGLAPRRASKCIAQAFDNKQTLATDHTALLKRLLKFHHAMAGLTKLHSAAGAM